MQRASHLRHSSIGQAMRAAELAMLTVDGDRPENFLKRHLEETLLGIRGRDICTKRHLHEVLYVFEWYSGPSAEILKAFPYEGGVVDRWSCDHKKFGEQGAPPLMVYRQDHRGIT